MLATRIEWMQQMPIFGGISAESLAFLLAPASELKVASGQFFFREGDPADCMFVLESGRVTVCKGWQGHALLLRRLGQGDCFGEMALLDLAPRSASVMADEDCSAIKLTSEHLYRLFKHDAEQFAMIQMNIGREVSRRLRATDELLFRARMGEALEKPERVGSIPDR